MGVFVAQHSIETATQKASSHSGLSLWWTSFSVLFVLLHSHTEQRTPGAYTAPGVYVRC